MIKTLKLYGIKSRPLFWQLLGAAVLQIAISLALIFTSGHHYYRQEGSLDVPVYIQIENMYNEVLPFSLIAIGIFFILFAMLKSDYNNCATYSVSRVQNYIANVLIAITLAVGVGVIGLLSDLISYCALRGVEGIWLNEVMDINTLKYVLFHFGRAILTVLTFTMVGYMIKEFFVRAKLWTIGILIVVAAIAIIMLFGGSMFGMGDVNFIILSDKWSSVIMGILCLLTTIANYAFAKFTGVKR